MPAMKFRSGVATMLVKVLFAGGLYTSVALSASSTAEGMAAAWLRAHHGAPQTDELAELKTVNPEAYAIVNALLTKRSLGMLDFKHPSASFAPKAVSADTVPPGPEVFESIAEESGEKLKVAPLYPEAPSVHHDWLNWKPQQSAIDDESMVQSVLGAVSELKTSGRLPHAAEAGSSSSWRSDSPAGPSPSKTSSPIADTKPIASMNQESSYLKGMDFGLGAMPVHSQPNPDENPYLKSIGIGSEMQPLHPKTIVASSQTRHPPENSYTKDLGLSTLSHSLDSENYLASFSWGDDAPSAKAKKSSAEVAPPAQVSAGMQKSGTKKDALLAWLSPEQPKHVAKRSAPASEEQQNPYLKDLNLY